MTHTVRVNPDGSLFVAGITDEQARLICSGRYTPDNYVGLVRPDLGRLPLILVRGSRRARPHVRRPYTRRDAAADYARGFGIPIPRRR